MTLDPPDASAARALESLLRWYLAMGVDAPVGETPHDRFVVADVAEARSSAVPTVRAQVSAPRSSSSERVPESANALLQAAMASAAEAGTIEDLAVRWQALPGCSLSASARFVFAAGRPGAPLMLIGGAPEADDERSGEAFSGAGGRLLDAMLGAIGLDRSAAYLANLVPWRPPGNRPPTPLELSFCLPFIRRHIALADPAVLLLLGERAAQPSLESSEPISRLRGRWLSYEGETKTVKTLVTFAPNYLLKQPLQKRHAWADLLMLAAELGT